MAKLVRAGFGTFPITPPVPGPLGGYAARQARSSGVHDPLWARALVLEQDGTKMGVVLADLVAAPRTLVHAVRSVSGPELAVPPERIIVAATHTHSGPAMPPVSGEADEPYQAWLPRALAAALALADRDCAPAHLAWGSGAAEGLPGNRRDPSLPSDPTVVALGFRRADGSLRGALINHACHPTVLAASNTMISADFPGAALSTLERLAPGGWFGFAQGAAGDVSCRFTRRGQTFDEVERMGGILAGAALVALSTAEPVQTGPLRVAGRSITMSTRDLPSAGEIEARLAMARERVQELRRAGAPSGDVRLAQSLVEGSMAEMFIAANRDALEVEAEIVAVAVGDCALVAVPGELFGSLGREIRRRSPAARTMVIGYANGYTGYVPDRQAYGSGGYEALATWLSPEAADAVIEASEAALAEATGRG